MEVGLVGGKEEIIIRLAVGDMFLDGGDDVLVGCHLWPNISVGCKI